MPMNDNKISAFVVCQNEEAQIRRCLESIKWCDEIVIVDSGSTDKTLEICREYTDKIILNQWQGYVEQKSFALQNCLFEWILNIDADEEVSSELQKEIKTAVLRENINGYYINRVVYHMGKWWRKGGWYPEYRLRLSRRLKTTWGGINPHEKAIVEGKTAKLKGELYHYTYKNLSDQINRLNKYSGTLAENLYKAGERSNFFKIISNPILRFIKFYFVKKGFLEGFPGFIVAVIEAFYVFLKYIKLRELQKTNAQV